MSSWDSSSSSTAQNRKNKKLTSQETCSAIDVRHFVFGYRAKTLLSGPGKSPTTARLQYLKRSRRSYGNQQSSQSSRSYRNFWKRLGRSGRSGRSYGNQALSSQSTFPSGYKPVRLKHLMIVSLETSSQACCKSN